MSDILGKGGDYKYSDEEHPKMPQNQEEYDEYINRRPNIASWKYSNLNIYHEIWDRRLKKQWYGTQSEKNKRPLFQAENNA